jgi:hypothetical protein
LCEVWTTGFNRPPPGPQSRDKGPPFLAEAKIRGPGNGLPRGFNASFPLPSKKARRSRRCSEPAPNVGSTTCGQCHCVRPEVRSGSGESLPRLSASYLAYSPYEQEVTSSSPVPPIFETPKSSDSNRPELFAASLRAGSRRVDVGRKDAWVSSGPGVCSEARRTSANRPERARRIGFSRTLAMMLKITVAGLQAKSDSPI